MTNNKAPNVFSVGEELHLLVYIFFDESFEMNLNFVEQIVFDSFLISVPGRRSSPRPAAQGKAPQAPDR